MQHQPDRLPLASALESGLGAAEIVSEQHVGVLRLACEDGLREGSHVRNRVADVLVQRTV